jgi:hypothetical protein
MIWKEYCLEGIMLYSRHDILDLIHAEDPNLHCLLISLIWHLSQGNPNEIVNNRFGLLMVPIIHARQIGFTAHENELLNPATNIQVGAQLISKLGLLEYLGREFVSRLFSITALETYLGMPAINQEQSMTPAGR